MAHCKRCNRFMVFGRKSGYCETCEAVVATEAENRRKTEEQERRKEDERRRREETERAELERKRIIDDGEDEQTPVEGSFNIEIVEPGSTEETEIIDKAQERLEPSNDIADEISEEISQEISIDKNEDQEDVLGDEDFRTIEKKSFITMPIQEKTEVLLSEQLKNNKGIRMVSDRNQTNVERYNSEEGTWTKYISISYRTNLFVLAINRDSNEEKIVNDLIEAGKASRHSNYPLPKIEGKVCCFVKSQDVEDVVKALISTEETELLVPEKKEVLTENEEEFDESVETPAVLGVMKPGTPEDEIEKTILHFTFWLQTYHRDEKKYIPRYIRSIKMAYKHLLCKKTPTDYDADEIERDADYVLEIFKKDRQWKPYDLYRDSFCLFEEFLGGCKLKAIPTSEDLKNGIMHHECMEKETVRAEEFNDINTKGSDSVENDKEIRKNEGIEENGDAGNGDNTRQEEQLVSEDNAEVRAANIQKRLDELESQIKQYRSEIVRMTAEQDRLLAEKKKITGDRQDHEKEIIPSASEEEINQSLEQTEKTQTSIAEETDSSTADIEEATSEENDELQDLDLDFDLDDLDLDWDEDTDEVIDEKKKQNDQSAIMDDSAPELAVHSEADLIIHDPNAETSNVAGGRRSDTLRGKTESILAEIVSEKQNVSIVPRGTYTTIRRKLMSGTRTWQIIATVSYRSFAVVVEVPKDAPEAENARKLLASGKVSGKYLNYTLPEKNNRIAFFVPAQKVEDVFDELLLDIATSFRGVDVDNENQLDEVIRQAAGQYASIPLERLGLSRRAYNGLRRSGIDTLGELLDLPEECLFSIRNLGAMSVGEIIHRRDEIIAAMDKASTESYDQEEEPVSEDKDAEEKSIAADDDVSDADKALYEIISSVPIDEISLSVRAYNALIRGGITNTEELLHLSDQEIVKFKQVGYKTATEIYDKKNELEAELNELKRKLAGIPSVIKESIRKYQQVEGRLFNRKVITLVLRLCAETDDMNDENAISILSSNDKLVSACVELLEDEITRAEFEGIRAEELSVLIPDFLNGENRELELTCFDRINADEDFYRTDDCYFRRLRSFADFVDGVPDERMRTVIQERAQGKTLEDVANGQEITRERIRQIEAKFWRTASTDERFIEDKYIRLLENYKIDARTFRTVFDESREVWYYANNRSHKNKNQLSTLEDAAFDNTLPSEVREAVRDFYENLDNASYLQFGEDRVPANRVDLETYVLSHYCKDIMLIDDFFDLYNQVLRDAGYESEDYLIGDSIRRTRENRISDLPNVLWSFNRRMRYYPVEKYDMGSLIRGLELDNYRDIEISTRKLMIDHPDLMEAYDIRNEYELHNLLKKQGVEDMVEGLHMGKMPMIQFGDISRADFILDMLFALAPISKDDFANAVSERTGLKPEIVFTKAEYVNAVNVYLHDGMLKIDSEAMPEEEMRSLLDHLANDCYTVEEIRNVYMQVTGKQDAELVSPYNLKRMGFKVYSGYVLKNYNNIDAYLVNILTKNEIVDYSEFAKRFSNMSEFSVVLNRLKDTFEVVEFEPGQLIRKDRLQRFGVTDDRLRAFCESVYQYVEPGQYFTIQSLKNDGFESSLFELGFGNWFYSSVLREDTRFGFRRMSVGYPALLFCRDVPKVTRQGFFEFLLDGGSMDRDELLDEIKNIYDIVIEKEDVPIIISDSEMYYDAIMEKVYANKELYYEEV